MDEIGGWKSLEVEVLEGGESESGRVGGWDSRRVESGVRSPHLTNPRPDYLEEILGGNADGEGDSDEVPCGNKELLLGARRQEILVINW